MPHLEIKACDGKERLHIKAINKFLVIPRKSVKRMAVNISHLIVTSEIFCTKNSHQKYIKLHDSFNILMFIYQLCVKLCYRIQRQIRDRPRFPGAYNTAGKIIWMPESQIICTQKNIHCLSFEQYSEELVKFGQGLW